MLEIVLLHISFSAILALVLAVLFGHLTPGIAAVSLVSASFLAAVLGGKSLINERQEEGKVEEYWFRPRFSWRQLSPLSRVMLAFLSFIVVRHLLYLFYYSEGWWKTYHPNNYGDLPLHLTYIRYFSGGNAFPPLNPIFTSEALRYPIGMDLYSSLWESLGAPTSGHLFLLGLASFSLIFVSLYQWARAWAWAAIFMNGGWIAWNFWSTKGGIQGAGDLAWKNLFTSLLLTQRGYLFAVPTGIVVLLAAYNLTFGNKMLQRRQGIIYGWLWGILAFFHLHSFLAVTLLVGLWTLLTRHWRRMLPVASVALVVALPFVLYSTGFLQKVSVIHWRLGWTLEDGDSLFSYWWKNFGPWLFLLFILGYEAVSGSLRKYRAYYFSVVLLLLLTQIISFAPWDWDNIKVIFWFYLALTPVIGSWVNDRLRLWQRDILLVVLFGPGALALSLSVQKHWQGIELYEQAEINIVRQYEKEIPANAIVATADTFSHPISFIGRGIVLGYAGHLWSHGIDAHEVQDALDRIYRGEADWKILVHRLGVTHLYWGRRERQKYQIGSAPWMEYRNLSSDDEVAIYDLQSIDH